MISALGWSTFYEGEIVFDAVVDAQGTVWVALSDGLTRFSGRAFGEPDEEHRPTQIAFDRQGRLWADSGVRMAVFDGTQWARFSLPEPRPTAFRELVVDADGRIWAATNRGLLRYDGDAWSLQAPPGGSESISSLAASRTSRAGRRLTLDEVDRMLSSVRGLWLLPFVVGLWSAPPQARYTVLRSSPGTVNPRE